MISLVDEVLKAIGGDDRSIDNLNVLFLPDRGRDRIAPVDRAVGAVNSWPFDKIYLGAVHFVDLLDDRPGILVVPIRPTMT